MFTKPFDGSGLRIKCGMTALKALLIEYDYVKQTQFLFPRQSGNSDTTYTGLMETGRMDIRGRMMMEGRYSSIVYRPFF